MKLSEKLMLIAEWLESSENDLLVNAEFDDVCLNVVANSLVKAASAIKEGAEELAKVEPVEITEQQLEELASVAGILDETGDETLMKQASVLDELLLTLAAPRGQIAQFRETIDDRIEELKKKYKNTKEKQDDLNKVSDAIKDIEKAPVYKTYRPLEAPLSTRTCLDHPGSPLMRVGEHTWQCALDKKIYNYETGFKTMQNNVVPGGDVSLQSQVMNKEIGHTLFDTRDERLGLGPSK